MPIFRTTENIKSGIGEYFDPNWMDSNTLILPEKEVWLYDREIRIEDVNVWEVITEPWDIGVYASWDPYAEFYLIRIDKDYKKLSNADWQQNVVDNKKNFEFETYYGPDASIYVQKRMDELGVNYILKSYWVEPEDMWLYPNS
jgi:hypothetical protein